MAGNNHFINRGYDLGFQLDKPLTRLDRWQIKQGSLIIFLYSLTLSLLLSCSQKPRTQRPTYPLPKDVEITLTNPGKYGGDFIITELFEPQTFNPLLTQGGASQRAIEHLFSRIVRFHPIKNQIVPALAKSWQISPDNKVYTFFLRQGINWSDGHPFSADDIVFTFDAIFDKRYPNRFANQYTIHNEPLRYEKEDSFAVRFVTPVPYVPFLNDITFIGILPKHHLQTTFDEGHLLKEYSIQTAQEKPNAIVTSGPFQIQSYRPGERLVYEPNPHYWRADSLNQRLPYLDRLIYAFVPKANTLTIQFTSGKTDAAEISATDYQIAAEAKDQNHYSLINRGAKGNIEFLWFNLNSGKDANGEPYIPLYKLKWFSDKRFRQAVAYGINREGIANAVYSDKAKIIHSIIAEEYGKWHNHNVKKYPYDPTTARRLLRDAGFSSSPDGTLQDQEGNSVAFELLVNSTNEQLKDIVTTLIENMKDLGIKVTPIYLEMGALGGRISQSFKYEAAMLGFRGGVGDPSGGKSIYRSDGHLHSWYPQQKVPATAWEARIDEIMTLQESEFDESKRIKLFHELQAIFCEELPLIFTLTPLTYAGIKNKWQNAVVPPIESMLWNLEEFWER